MFTSCWHIPTGRKMASDLDQWVSHDRVSLQTNFPNPTRKIVSKKIGERGRKGDFKNPPAASRVLPADPKPMRSPSAAHAFDIGNFFGEDCCSCWDFGRA